MRKRWPKLFVGSLALLVLALLASAAYLSTRHGEETLAASISRSASSPDSKVEIGALDGLLSTHPVARDITLADRDGVWLKIDRIAVDWSPLALLGFRLDIKRIDIPTVDMLRRPIPSAETPKETNKAKSANAGAWSGLPIRVWLGEFALGKLSLGEPVVGATAALSANAAFEAGALGDSARFSFDARRLDAPGTYRASGAFRPGDKTLRLDALVSEPAGGLVARVAELPGLPPVKVTLDGDGTPHDFAVKLTANAGDAATVDGDARLTRAQAGRRLDFILTSEFAKLLPKEIAGLFAAGAKLEGAVLLEDNGAATLERFELQSSAFALEASGKLDAVRNIDGRAKLRGLPTAEGAAFSAGTLVGDATIAGSLMRPSAGFDFLMEEAEGAGGRFEHIDLSAKVIADADLSDPSARLDIQAQGHGAGLAFADPALADAIGSSASLWLRARVNGAGDADIGLAKIETGASAATFSGHAGPEALEGRLNISAPDLSRFARLAGRSLRGALTLAADLSGAPRDGRIAAKFNGAVTNPAIGVAAVDGLLGPKLLLTGGASILPDGGFSFDGLSLQGDRLSARINGAATMETAAVEAHVDLPDLHALDPRLSGQGDIKAALTGSLKRPNATFSASLHDARANGRPIAFDLKGEAHDLRGAATAVATLDGEIDGRPAQGRVRVARVGTGWKVDDLNLAIGRNTVTGALTLDAAGLAKGRVAVAAPHLNDLSPLALQELAGQLNAEVALDANNGAQDISVDAQGAGVRAPYVRISKLNATFSMRDLYRRPALDGDIAVDAASFGDEQLRRLRLTAKPTDGGAAALDLSLDARGFAIASRATLTPGERMRLDIAQFSAQRAGQKVTLAKPATVTVSGANAELNGVSLALGAGRLDIDGFVGDRLDLVAKGRAIPLSIASLVDPTLGLGGTLDVEARIQGFKSAPQGDWRIKLAKATTAQLRANGLPAANVTASGRLDGSRTTLDADIAIGARSKLKIAGSAPLGEGGLELSVKGPVDAAIVNTMLAANGQTVAGKAMVDLKLSGAAASPIIGGAVTLENGAFDDPLNGVSLGKINGRLEGRGRDLNITSLTAQTKNGGQIAVTGSVNVAPDAGMPVSLHVVAHNALLADTDIAASTGDLDLTISGPLARAPKVAGSVKLASLDVNVPDRLPTRLKPIPGARHIDAKGFAAQMLALERQQKAKAGKQSNFDAALDLAISAPNRIFVRGHGIDAEFGGDLKIGGTIQKPIVVGGFDLQRGRLQLLTQRIDITRGRVTFTGGLKPQLDFTAEAAAADVTARITVTGPASQPTFTFSSTPELPQDEVLSRLLFSKASGSLTASQAVQLAAALAQFSGAATGVDAFEKMRKALGVDSLDIDAGGAGGPTVGASRYIMRGVNVGVRTGPNPSQSAVTVGVDVTKGVRVQSETRADGKTSVGVGLEWEY